MKLEIESVWFLKVEPKQVSVEDRGDLLPKNCKVKYRVSYDKVWYLSQILLPFPFVLLSTSDSTSVSYRWIISLMVVLVVLTDMFIAVENSSKWRSGELKARYLRDELAFFLWDRGLELVLNRKHNYLESKDTLRLVIQVRDVRLLRRKIYTMKFESIDCFQYVIMNLNHKARLAKI